MRTNAILIYSVVGMLAGCGTTFEKIVRDDLKINNVIIPASNAYRPFSIVQYSEKSNYQVVCPATQVTGLSTDESVKAAMVESDIATFGVADNASGSISVSLSPAEVANVDAKYQRISSVELSLRNGKVVKLADEYNASLLFDAPLKNQKCRENTMAFMISEPDSRFYGILSLFKYDVSYTIKTKDGVDVTTEMPLQLKQIVLRKIGLNYNHDSSIGMNSTQLYVGFRGLNENNIPKDIAAFNSAITSYASTSRGGKSSNMLMINSSAVS